MTEDEIRAILVSAVKEGVLSFTMNQYGKKTLLFEIGFYNQYM